jgi:orotate phosphoribosyltransferase
MRKSKSTGKTMKKRLIELILKRSFKYTTKPTFTLASGKKSNFYFNCKPTTLNHEGMFLVGNLLFQLIKKQKTWKVHAVGGLTLGADPVAYAIAYTAHLKGMPMEAKVKGVVVLIDRQEGGKEAIEKMGVSVKSLLTKEDIFKVYKKT